MSKIRKLSDLIINQIAAGEVIENSSSVVKELVENSLDAGSSSVLVEISMGGRALIRVSDNGCGMNLEDALLAFERHATSKIEAVDDLDSLHTMGFRGEALASIASIAKVRLITNETSDLSQAIMLQINGGKLIEQSATTASQGSLLEIKDIFFNIPVRKKYQKSPNFDSKAILKTMYALALGNPGVEFELVSDGKQLLKTRCQLDQPLSVQTADRVSSVIGEDTFSQMIPLNFDYLKSSEGQVKITGYIGLPTLNRANRGMQHLFINGRAVFSSPISYFVKLGYGSMLPEQRFPSFVLYLELPKNELDVNVHPQKREVRLKHEPLIKHLVIKAVQSALNSYQQQNFCSQTEIEKPDYEPFKFDSSNFAAEEPAAYLPVQELDKIEPGTKAAFFQQASFALPEKASYQQIMADIDEGLPKVLLTLPNYLVLEAPHLKLPPPLKHSCQGICLLSQTNSFARLIYDDICLKKSFKLESQMLAYPITLNFLKTEVDALEAIIDKINSLGINLSQIGPETYQVEAFPSFIAEKDLKDFILNFIDAHSGNEKFDPKNFEPTAALASRIAKKFKLKLSFEEAASVVEKLFASSSPFLCPLGRPTISLISNLDLSKFF